MESWQNFLFGIILGWGGGLVAGLHSNTIISVLASIGIEDASMAIIIIALFPAHLITSLIPAIFFGIPETNNVTAILPGQRLVLEGRGITALKVAVLSMLLATLLSVAVFFLTFDFYKSSYGILKGYMKYILLLFSIILLIKSKNPIYSFVIFIGAGALGKYAFSLKLIDPFLPIFSGMFALAAILNYQKGKVPLPPQGEESVDKEVIPYILLGVILGLLADILPGVGSPSQIATLASILIPFHTLNYIATTSAISVSQAVFSFSTAASIDKARVGATAWLDKFVDIKKDLPSILLLFIISLSVSAITILLLRKRIAGLTNIDYNLMNRILFVYLIVINFLINGFWGLLVLSISTILGWLTLRLEVERTTLMGAIIVPTLLLLFRIFF